MFSCVSVSSLTLFYRYYFHRCSNELASYIPPHCQGRVTLTKQRRVTGTLWRFAARGLEA
ncbi:hypothetical protein SK128_028336 [Halocaridina rubra]|uniref:Uncharacterized protein n=1 Tax=Halocaridina rubra TaxID=373956 RepID=A0AAN8XET7_HALRR